MRPSANSFAAAWVSRERETRTRVNSTTRLSSSPAGSTSSRNRVRSARSVSINSPENSRYLAVAGPTRAVNRLVEDAEYTRPSFAGVTPNSDPSSANRRSQAAASCAPPPTQCPRIAASTGFGKAASVSSASTDSRCASSGEPLSVEMSAPEQNVPPAPVSTRTRTSGSAARVASSGGSARHMPTVMALSLAGWLMTTVAIPSAELWVSCGSMRRIVSAGAERPDVDGTKPVQPE